MILSLVVAASDNNAIGKNNQLLWHLPEDLKYFKNITWAMPVLMGRVTFQSLGNKPLSGRLNIVLTRQKNFTAPGIIVVHRIEDALFVAQQQDYKELMILGGGELYRSMISKADNIYITRVHASFEDADTFFPEIDPSKWQLINNQDCLADARHAYDYSFQLWKKK